MCTQLKIHDILNKVISLIVPEVSFILAQFNICLVGLECPLLLRSSARSHRRCAATLPRLLERTFPGLVSFSVLLEAADGEGLTRAVVCGGWNQAII